MNAVAKSGRIDIGTIRREQIVDAAVAVIAEQGLHHLSLSEIEKKVGMSRGQLTYYFKAKEEILLAVFDRLVLLMHQQQPAPPADKRQLFEMLGQVLGRLVKEPLSNPAFHALHCTFLAQISHRADFRGKLAELYESWRQMLAEDVENEQLRHPERKAVNPRAMATVIEAMIHGLITQAAADPDAFDADEVVDLCIDMIGTYLRRHDKGAN
ncbi:MAG: TetR/AcrR family transcriptional regulator [Planctomycetota bacterium]